MTTLPVPAPSTPVTVARTFDSGFADAALSYNSLSTASDGNVYYALTSEKYNVSAQMFRYDPKADKITHLADLTEIVGETNLNAVVQGKCHVNFHEMDRKLYFSTHLGFYQTDANNREFEGTPPAGVKPYPGGHFVSYDLTTGAFDDFGIPVSGEGLIAVALDTQRKLFYGLSWPSGFLVQLNLATRAFVNFGPTAMGGEKADPPNYSTLCRAMEVDPVTGYVYTSTAEGCIVTLANGAVTSLNLASLNRDILGVYDIATPGELGYAWRQTVLHAPQRLVCAVHGRTGFLIRFDLATGLLQIVHRITSIPTNVSGQYDAERHGYLSFKLGPDGETIYFLTGAHIDDASTEAGIENIHLVTYHILSGEYFDRGAVMLDDGSRPSGINSIAITTDNTVYAFSKIPSGSSNRYDLISFKVPAAPPSRQKLL